MSIEAIGTQSTYDSTLTKDQSSSDAQGINQQRQLANEKLPSKEDQTDKKTDRNVARRFDQFYKDTKQSSTEPTGIYFIKKEESGTPKIIFNQPEKENSPEANNKNNPNKSSDPSNEKEPKKEITTIKVNCNEGHEHTQQCPHTTTTIPASPLMN